MNRYHVFSLQGEVEVREVTRSDRKVADQDAGIIKDMFRRKSWVVDTEEVTRD